MTLLMMKVNKTYEIIKVVFIYNTGCLYIGDEIIYKYRTSYKY